MKHKSKIKILAFILITTLASSPVMAGLFQMIKCIVTDTTTTETSGCSRGRGCIQIREIRGVCQKSNRYLAPGCEIGVRDGIGDSYITSGSCSKDNDGNVVCIKFDFRNQRYVSFRSDCKHT